MTYVRIATGAEMPINRHGGLAKFAGEQADLVGVDSTGGVVAADADTANLVKARGVLLASVTDPAGMDDVLQPIVKSNRVIVNRDRVSYIEYGIVLENSDEDWNFTSGNDVYLAVGGGFTDVNPDPDGTLGHLVQKVGYAIDDGNAVVLHVDQSA